MTEQTLWDRMRENVARGIRSAADRTDELARVGKLKLDLVNLKRKVVYEMGELGKQLLAHIDHAGVKGELGSIKDFIDTKQVQEILERINRYRDEIADTEEHISQMSAATQTTAARTQEDKDQSPTENQAKDNHDDKQ